MGFLPIFLTLGAFVFLFAMVVHRNFQKKKKDYFTFLDQYNLLMSDLKDQHHSGFRQMEGWSLEEVEASLQLQKDPEAKNASLEKLSNAKHYLREAKRIRYQYQNLLQTKPYSFVGKLMGHRPI